MKFLTLFAITLAVTGLACLEFAFLAPLYALGLVGASLLLLDALFVPSLLPFTKYYPGRRLATVFGFLALLVSGGLGTFAYLNPLHDVVTDPLHAPKILHLVPRFRVDKGAEYLGETIMTPGDFDPKSIGSGHVPGTDPLRSSLPPLDLQRLLARYLAQQPPHPARVEKPWMAFLYDLFPTPKLVLRDDTARHLEYELEIPLIHVVTDLAFDVTDNPAESGRALVQARARTRLPLPDLGWAAFVLKDFSERIQDLVAAPPVEKASPVVPPKEKANTAAAPANEKAGAVAPPAEKAKK